MLSSILNLRYQYKADIGAHIRKDSVIPSIVEAYIYGILVY
jgi:hypothetical protein